jgi:steroid delta-isomerase-like uncharacterized protein
MTHSQPDPTRTVARKRGIALSLAVATAAVIGVMAVPGSASGARTATSHRATSHDGKSAIVAANKRVVLAFIKDVLAEHHGDHAVRYMSPNIQFHAGTVGTVVGRAQVAGVLSGVVTAIPDLHPAVKDIFGEGNEVVVRLVVSGTQTGDLLGIPASGRAVSWDAVDVYQLKNAKIRQEWAAEDLTAILNDTGTYKAPWIP